MYAKDLIEEDPSDLSSRADALGTFQVDPLASHRATKSTKKKNKSVNLHENDKSLTSTSEEDEQITEPECRINITTKSPASSAKRGARYRSKSRQFNNTLKWATQTDRHRIKLLNIVEEGRLVRKYQVSSTRDWLGYGPYTVPISKAPSCTCDDFVKSRTVKICNHIIWVYVAILGVDTSSNTLQQAALIVQEVRNIFDNAPLPQPLSPSLPTRSNQGQQRKVQSSTSSSDAESRASKVIEKDH